MTVAPSRVGFLGPPGTFTQEALLQVFDPDAAELVYYDSAPEVVHAVADGDVDVGMVPIENSVEGPVNATIDAIGFETEDLVMQREVILPIRLHLLARPGTALADVKELFSMPVATAQCKGWIRRNMAGVKIVDTGSTAEAAGRVAYQAGPSAAIGPNLAAQLFGLDVIQRDVSDHAEAETRFVVVGRETAPRTGRDKTSLMVFISEDKPGALMEILQVFYERNLNLTRIESRPTKRVLGEYCFFLDLEGHREDAVVAEAIEELHKHSSKVRFLGSYPRAIGRLDAERLARRARAAKPKHGGE